jgi:hypothetical protein
MVRQIADSKSTVLIMGEKWNRKNSSHGQFIIAAMRKNYPFVPLTVLPS